MTTYNVSYMYRGEPGSDLCMDNEDVILTDDTDEMSPGQVSKKLESILSEMYPMLSKIVLINFWKM